MSNIDPMFSGKHNAESIIDESGLAAAEQWLKDRIANKTRKPLDPRYIQGFQFALEIERKLRHA